MQKISLTTRPKTIAIKQLRPLLEYRFTLKIYSSHLIMLTNSSERVQQYFTKKIIELQDLSYHERLTVLNLETLEYRRL